MFGMDWLKPETLIASFGAFAMIGVCLIVFIETGLLVGFFLPGDSLLFVTGLMIAAPVYWMFTKFLGINLPGLTESGWL